MTPAGRILITGGAGSCGSHLTHWLLKRNYEVRVLDRQVEPLRTVEDERLTLIEGSVEDRDLVRSALDGVEGVFHLAWSFSEDPLEVFQKDLVGHIYLLEEMAARRVKHLIYTSTAVVYGKLQYSPIDEKHPLVVEEARKPLYGIAKAAAEKLCLMYQKQKELPATVIRFWWAYSDDIGGKHLREMLRTAAKGDTLEVPAGSGGSFVHMDDLTRGMGQCLFNPDAHGRTFNLATVYVTWEEVAAMVREVTGSFCEVRVVPVERWKGSAFLADPWELDDTAAREVLGYEPLEGSRARDMLKEAIATRWRSMQG